MADFNIYFQYIIMDNAFMFEKDESLKQFAVDDMEFEFDFAMCHGSYYPCNR